MAPHVCVIQYAPHNLQVLLEKFAHWKSAKVVIALNSSDLPYEREIQPMASRVNDFSFSDFIVSGFSWYQNFYLLLPEYDCDSIVENIRKKAERDFIFDLGVAENIVAKGGIIIRLKSANNTNLARMVLSKRNSTFFVQVPLYSPARKHAHWRQDFSPKQNSEEDSWHWWNTFRIQNNYRKNLRVILEVDIDTIPTKNTLLRWLGEPVEAVIVPTDMFRYGPDKLAMFTVAWQRIMIYFFHAQVNIIISGSNEYEYFQEIADCLHGYFYVFSGEIEMGLEYETDLMLYLPKQAVHDNNNFISEKRDKHSVKYMYYLNAIYEALADIITDEESKTNEIIIIILGAGRGELIRTCLTAATKSARKVRIYAVESHEIYMHRLLKLKEKLWNKEDIHVIHKDLRDFEPPEQADIVVSDLLGSFGDDELMPECLSNVKNLLKPDGICIPCMSNSYINPIMCPKLRNLVCDENWKYHQGNKHFVHMESHFQAYMRNTYHISNPKRLFEFIFTTGYSDPNNRRSRSVRFRAEMDSLMDGIAGYFESTLYKDIIISNNRLRHTPGLESWFPMYFPLMEPIEVKKGQIIELNIWRCVNKSKVWYEWCCIKPRKTFIHNQGGKSFSMLLR